MLLANNKCYCFKQPLAQHARRALSPPRRRCWHGYTGASTSTPKAKVVCVLARRDVLTRRALRIDWVHWGAEGEWHRICERILLPRPSQTAAVYISSVFFCLCTARGSCPCLTLLLCLRRPQPWMNQSAHDRSCYAQPVAARGSRCTTSSGCWWIYGR